MKITKNQGYRVKKLLTTYKHMRDNDMVLLTTIWREELGGKMITLEKFFTALSDGKFSNPESVRRARQKAQQQYTFLRGEKYKERHTKRVDDMKKSIKKMEKPSFLKTLFGN